MGQQRRPAEARPTVIEHYQPTGSAEPTDPASRQRRGAHAARTAPAPRTTRAKPGKPGKPAKPGKPGKPAKGGRKKGLALHNWPVARRLFAVIALAAAMGLILGGLQVANAVSRASQFARVTQLARVGQQALVLASALEEERAQAAMSLAAHDGDGTNLPQEISKWAGPPTSSGLASTQGITGQAMAEYQRLAAGIGGGFPDSVQSRLAAVQSNVIDSLAGMRSNVQRSGTPAPDGGQLDVIADYSNEITTLFQLTDTIAQSTGDSELTNEVLSLGALDRAVDQASQQRAILWALFASYAFKKSQYVDDHLALTPLATQDVPLMLEDLATSETQQAGYLQSFSAEGTPAENAAINAMSLKPWPNSYMQDIEEYVVDNRTPDLTGIGSLPQAVGSRLPAGTGVGISPTSAPADWNVTSADVVQQYTGIQSQVAQAIVDRSVALKQAAERSAWETGALSGVVLLLVLLAALLVARSLVRPLRRLRAGALEVASVSLPERVRQLSQATEASAPLEVEPISVLSTDEIGQVARAFDLVHQEAIRLAGDEAMLRNSLNAMFVSLSRRSQLLIERLSRVIDTLEQNEDDPDRLSSLFTMDHMITRMRRNSENLLVLAGHEGARKRADPELLGDVVRAATSEIEQYGRVVINVQPGIEVSGQAATDIVHLLAEIVENATLYSPRNTEVHVTAQELTTGGVLIEVADSGVGISESRMNELNVRLEHPPVVDVSVSRHMGLFAVSHLAARHGVAVRLRPASQQGVVAMVWLPDTIARRATVEYGERLRRLQAERASAPAAQDGPSYQALKRGGPELAATGAGNRAHGPSGAQGPSGVQGNGAQGNGAHSLSGVQGNGSQGNSSQSRHDEPAGWGMRAAADGPERMMDRRPAAGSPEPVAERRQPAAEPEPMPGRRSVTAGPEPTAGRRTAAERPTSSWFTAQRTSGSQDEAPAARPPSLADRPAPPQDEPGRRDRRWAADPQWDPGLAGPEPVTGGTTGAGLPLRVPQANRQAEEVPVPLAAPPGAPRPGTSEATGGPLTKRSPDAARSRLSGFQHGARRAEARDPRAEEGMDR